ncbi:hypothetical protein V6246_00805 [Algibacter sp. TI.3.09]|uniref:hypothetical protein n=1 Tax=Algibacter sp. TI.3.09 TaxID=3121298 RepID=UPI00311FDA65
MISNIRCLNRQKSFIKAIEFKGSTLVCAHFNGKKTKISYDNLVYSFREIKFEKDKSEIEIKEKKRITNKLIGRLNINDWQTIFEIKNALAEKKIKRIEFQPEGFWSKYGWSLAELTLIEMQ